MLRAVQVLTKIPNNKNRKLYSIIVLQTLKIILMTYYHDIRYVGLEQLVYVFGVESFIFHCEPLPFGLNDRIMQTTCQCDPGQF